MTAKRKGLIEKIDVPLGRARYPFHSKRSVRWSRYLPRVLGGRELT